MQERDVPGPRGAQVTIEGSTVVVTGASTGIGGPRPSHSATAGPGWSSHRAARNGCSRWPRRSAGWLSSATSGTTTRCRGWSTGRSPGEAGSTSWSTTQATVRSGCCTRSTPSGRRHGADERDRRDQRGARSRRGARPAGPRRRDRQRLLDRRRVPRPRQRRVRREQGRRRPARRDGVSRAARPRRPRGQRQAGADRHAVLGDVAAATPAGGWAATRRRRSPGGFARRWSPGLPRPDTGSAGSGDVASATRQPGRSLPWTNDEMPTG